MKHRDWYPLFVSGLALGVAFACGTGGDRKTVIPPKDKSGNLRVVGTPIDLDAKQVVTFDGLKSELLEAQCATCHSSQIQSEVDFRQWAVESDKAWDQTKLWIKVAILKDMPPKNPLSSEMLRNVQSYLSGKSLELLEKDPFLSGTSTPEPTPEPSSNGAISKTERALTFSKLQDEVFQPGKCASCHGTVVKSAHDLEQASWISQRLPASEQKLLVRTHIDVPKGSIMPPPSVAVLTEEQKSLIRDFVELYLTSTQNEPVFVLKTIAPTPSPVPTMLPSAQPTPLPTAEPTSLPTAEPTPLPPVVPTPRPTPYVPNPKVIKEFRRVFNRSCAWCHGSGSFLASDLSTEANMRRSGYIGTGGYQYSSLYQSVVTGDMPGFPFRRLNQNELKTVKNYVEELQKK
jgi:mono/diheme cytochrome c family protein